jgi:hypothetical protein
MASLQALVERFAMVSLEKQAKLAGLIGDHYFHADLDEGRVRFSDAWECPFQVLGTESDNTLTWLWGWADEQSEVPDHLLTAVQELRKWGIQNNVVELTLPSIDLNRADGTMLSMIASPICRANAFYREYFDGGSLFVLLFGDAVDRQPGFDRSGFLRALTEHTSVYSGNHRALIASYFRELNLPYQETSGAFSGELAVGERIVAEFDPSGMITTINGEPFPSVAGVR